MTRTGNSGIRASLPLVLLLFTGGADQCGLALQSLEIPAGTTIHLRLETPVASNVSRPGEKVRAVVTSPVASGEQVLLPAGAIIHGAVTQAQLIDETHEQAMLGIDFGELEGREGRRAQLSARITGVDNARESVDEAGRIIGILPAQTITNRIDQALGRLGTRYESLAAVLLGVKQAFLKEAQPEIVYPAGTEMTVQLSTPLVLASAFSGGTVPAGTAGKPDNSLEDLVNSQPFETMAEDPPRPSDLTNLMFLGTEAAIAQAFKAAGWSTAAELSAASKMETVRAVLEARGYSEAPVSLLLLDGRKPDLVFQKQLNTFAKRHHLRVWRRPGDYGGQPVWVSAATHDIDIEFSAENRTFIHKIDSDIDRERAKVVADLRFTGKVSEVFMIERPGVPRETKNATGDALITDGKIAVVVLAPQ